MLLLGRLLLLSLLRALIVIQGVDAAREGLLTVRQNLHQLHQGGEDRREHGDGFAAPDVDSQMSGVHGASHLGSATGCAGAPYPTGGAAKSSAGVPSARIQQRKATREIRATKIFF